MTAATHGLTEVAETLKAKVRRDKLAALGVSEAEAGEIDLGLPEPREDAELLFPPTRVSSASDEDWPFLNVCLFF